MKYLLAFLLFVGQGQAQTAWNYGNQNGWPETQCKDGNKQSPIKIDPTLDDFEIIDDAQPFSFVGWDQVPKSSKLMNAGKLLKAMFEFEKPAMLIGGNLSAKYNLAEIHFHWGPASGKGHEHEIKDMNGRMEIQFIHVKDGFDKDLNKAVEQSNGTNDTLAILSVLAKFQKSDNAKIKALFDAASQVTTENSTKEFSGVVLKDLLPRNTNGFYRYEGSLTYPNCTEAAIWTIFKDPLYISSTQHSQFISISTLNQNLRNLQTLQGRKIKDMETSKKSFSSGNSIMVNTAALLAMNTFIKVF